MDNATMVKLTDKVENERRNVKNAFKNVEEHFKELERGQVLTINGLNLDLNTLIEAAQDLRDKISSIIAGNENSE